MIREITCNKPCGEEMEYIKVDKNYMKNATFEVKVEVTRNKLCCCGYVDCDDSSCKTIAME